jgi:GNAT superfamily N-acetyltransferase
MVNVRETRETVHWHVSSIPEAAFSPAEIRLRDGRRVTLRAVIPADRAKLQDAIRRLSPDARYARFMTPLRELGPDLLERAVNPEQDRELQLVAVTGDAAGQTIVGGARYSPAPGSKVCEFALAVVDDWQGAGLARRLLEALIEAARARDFETMEGYVLT